MKTPKGSILLAKEQIPCAVAMLEFMPLSSSNPVSPTGEVPGVVGEILRLRGVRLSALTTMTSSDHEGVTPEVAAFVDQVDLWDKDVPKAAAIWEWRFHFDMHWGDHAIDALRALHRACARG